MSLHRILASLRLLGLCLLRLIAGLFYLLGFLGFFWHGLLLGGSAAVLRGGVDDGRGPVLLLSGRVPLRRECRGSPPQLELLQLAEEVRLLVRLFPLGCRCVRLGHSGNMCRIRLYVLRLGLLGSLCRGLLLRLPLVRRCTRRPRHLGDGPPPSRGASGSVSAFLLLVTPEAVLVVIVVSVRFVIVVLLVVFLLFRLRSGASRLFSSLLSLTLGLLFLFQQIELRKEVVPHVLHEGIALAVLR
mmetsp:Transcript_8188/g.34399  ORF Transcript_8188/g.34399 Transcript_8188/m.34399 type:complete len:243 (-) Transcript_8188:105-833(-)